HRYIYEDVPTGLIPIASFGRHLGLPTPFTESLIQMACGVTATNYWLSGRTVQSLGLADMSPADIRHYAVTGFQRPASAPGGLAYWSVPSHHNEENGNGAARLAPSRCLAVPPSRGAEVKSAFPLTNGRDTTRRAPGWHTEGAGNPHGRGRDGRERSPAMAGHGRPSIRARPTRPGPRRRLVGNAPGREKTKREPPNAAALGMVPARMSTK